MRAIGDYIIIKKAPNTVRKTSGGFEYTDKHEDIRYIDAEVLDVGNNSAGITKGDKILYDKVGGHDIIVQGELLTVIRNRDVVVILD